MVIDLAKGYAGLCAGVSAECAQAAPDALCGIREATMRAIIAHLCHEPQSEISGAMQRVDEAIRIAHQKLFFGLLLKHPHQNFDYDLAGQTSRYIDEIHAQIAITLDAVRQ